jgi:hypothetical protein
MTVRAGIFAIAIAGSLKKTGVLFSTRTENERQKSNQSTDTISVANFEHRRAPLCRIHISVACDQQMAHFNTASTGSPTQRSSRAPFGVIHVSFACNQQLALLKIAISGSNMQSV